MDLDYWFDEMKFRFGLLSEENARIFLMTFYLSVSTLDKIWELSDQDKDGFLDKQDFLVAFQLIEKSLRGEVLPDEKEDQYSRKGYFHIVR